MSYKSKKLVILSMIIISVSLITALNNTTAVESQSLNRVVDFLQNVGKVDVKKYNVTLVLGPFVDHRPELGGLAETTGKYSLESETSRLDVLFTFTGNTLTWCIITVIKGSVIYNEQMPSSLKDFTVNFIQSYSLFIQDSSLNIVLNSINEVDFSKDSVLTSDNSRFKITHYSYSTSIDIRTTFAGAAYSGLGITFFKDGGFAGFSDDRSYYMVGDSTVSITKEQAVSLALEKAGSFSYTYAGSVVDDLSVAVNYVSAELLTRSKFVPCELYPYWRVTLPLDDFYPGSVTQIMVDIWAGTGEVFRVYPLGVGGYYPPTSADPSHSASAEPLPSESPSVAPASVSPQPILSPSESPLVSASVSPARTLLPSSTDSEVDDLRLDWVPVAVFTVAVAAVVAAIAGAVLLRMRRGRAG